MFTQYNGSLNESELAEDYEVISNMCHTSSEAVAVMNYYIQLMNDGMSDIDAFKTATASIEE